MKKRGRRLLLEALAVLFILGIGAWILRPRDNILDHATRLASTKVWGSGNLAGRFGYFWLNDREVLYLKPETDNSISLVRKLVFPTDNLQPPSPMIGFIPASGTVMDVSPDGNYLTYYTYQPRSGPNAPDIFTSILLSLKDGQRTKLSNDWINDRFWTPDSTGFIEIQTSPALQAGRSPAFRIDIRNIRTKQTRRYQFGSFTKGPITQIFVPLFMDNLGRVVCVENGPYFLPSMAVLPSLTAHRNATQITLAELNIHQTQKPVRIWNIPVPRGAAEGQIFPSPRHDRLLWVFYTEDSSSLDAAIHRIFPQYPVRIHTFTNWQITGLDGKDLRVIARFEPTREQDISRFPQWTPDGNRLSFICNDALYWIPVQ